MRPSRVIGGVIGGGVILALIFDLIVLPVSLRYSAERPEINMDVTLRAWRNPCRNRQMIESLMRYRDLDKAAQEEFDAVMIATFCERPPGALARANSGTP